MKKIIVLVIICMLFSCSASQCFAEENKTSPNIKKSAPARKPVTKKKKKVQKKVKVAEKYQPLRQPLSVGFHLGSPNPGLMAKYWLNDRIGLQTIFWEDLRIAGKKHETLASFIAYRALWSLGERRLIKAIQPQQTYLILGTSKLFSSLTPNLRTIHSTEVSIGIENPMTNFNGVCQYFELGYEWFKYDIETDLVLKLQGVKLAWGLSFYI